MKSTTLLSIGFRFLATTLLLIVLAQTAVAEGTDNRFAAFHQPNGDWYEAGDAMLNPGQSRLLVGKPGTGVLINGKLGECPSLVTKKRDYRDVEVHVEFMVAQGSNSGIIFHGNHEIQILDSYGIQKPTAGHCGGIYPRAENEPTYHHIDKGSPPRVNAAKQPGQWQTMDIIFQAARFDEDGKKTAHAKFVRVVHNGQVIQENHEVPYACGPNWDRKQFPQGPIIIQGDYGPIAVRNVRIKTWKADEEKNLNVPPEGFTALFNGKDFTGWHTPPLVKEYWSIEDGVLKSPGLRLSNLRVLSLQDCGVDDPGLEHLSGLTNLEDLTLFRTFVSDDGMQHVGKLTKLRRLNLRATVVGSEGLAHLKALQSLERLDLSETIVGNEGLSHIKALPNLVDLNLWATRVGDEGMPHLAEMSELKRLNLDNVGFSREGISLTSKGVKQLVALENLEWLHLGKTDVDDEGVMALTVLVKLAALDVNTCQNVTSEGIAKLQAARPDIRIQR